MLLFVFWLGNRPSISKYDMEKRTVPDRSNFMKEMTVTYERKVCYIYQRKKQISQK